MPEPEPDRPADYHCPVCDEQIPAADAQRHEDGIDARRLGCAHQDIGDIRQAQRVRGQNWASRVW